MMYFSKVAAALINVSIGVVAQTPHGEAYFSPPTPKDKYPLNERLSTLNFAAEVHSASMTFFQA
jgi:hypothetical protein